MSKRFQGKTAAGEGRPETFCNRRVTGRWTAAAGLLAVLVGAPLWAQQSRIYREGNTWVEETRGTLPASRQVRINTDFGSVQVQGNSPEVTYLIRKRTFAGSEEEARRQFALMKVTAMRNAEADAIEGRLAGNALVRFNMEFVVQVPREFALLKVDTKGGALSFTSIAAPIMGSTHGGAVKLDDLFGPVKITSGGGTVEAGNLGSDLTLVSGGGDVRINSVAGQTKVNISGGRVYVGSSRGVSIQTGAGNVQVTSCTGDLVVSTGGGNLYLGDVSGSVQAATLAGSVRLASAQGRVQVSTSGGSVELLKLAKGAQVETGTGPITVEFVGGSGFSDSLLRTAAGDVTVYFPRNLPVTVHASSDLATGKGIESEMPGLRITTEGGNVGPKAMYAEGQLNGGGPMLRVRTTIGQIAFRQSH